MNMRWEVTEEVWLETFADEADPGVDYVLVDLGRDLDRAWLADARERVELVGWSATAATEELLERALSLDVDFFCAVAAGAGLDWKRLPLRLIVEERVVDDRLPADLVGAAWARRIHGWEGLRPERLAHLARRERIILAGAQHLPDAAFLAQTAPFAVSVPRGVSAAELRASTGA